MLAAVLTAPPPQPHPLLTNVVRGACVLFLLTMALWAILAGGAWLRRHVERSRREFRGWPDDVTSRIRDQVRSGEWH